jgi:hypothetical protein
MTGTMAWQTESAHILVRLLYAPNLHIAAIFTTIYTTVAECQLQSVDSEHED